MNIETTSPRNLPEIFSNGYTVIDVRSPKEFQAAHVAGAENLPLDQLDGENFCGRYGDGFPVYILCQTSKRGFIAAERLIQAGHKSVSVIEGGTDAAIDAHIDMEYGEGAISIERQVRIAAGALVLIGTLLGLWVHAGFLAVPIVVAAGLIFAGISNSCGMGLLLAKCPWNQ